MRLRGKHKPTFTPHVDDGDNVIVINADKVRADRQEVRPTRSIYWHTGHPGGIKERTCAPAASKAAFPSASSRRPSSA